MATGTKEPPVDKSTLSGYRFGIEADERRNGDILLQSIPGARLRGAIDASKPIIAHPKQNMVDFQPTIPPDQSSGLGMLGKIPGQQIFVNPEKLTYKIVDPLCNNEEICNRIASAMKTSGINVVGDKIYGVKELKGTLDVDRMKTLCRELRWLVESGDAREIPGKGELPSLEEIDKLKGDYLLNPGERTKSMQPRYEKDLEDWVQRLARGGG